MNPCVNQLNVLRMVRAHAFVVGDDPAAEERQAGPDWRTSPIGIGTVRRAVGAAFVWTGRRVQGAHRPETVVGTAEATA